MPQGFTCFLIDDDVDDQEIFTMALADADPSGTCITARNGLEALEKLKQDETFIPDFIFLDLNMPVMNGKQCLEEIKKIPRLGQIPVLIYSTSSHPKDLEEAKRLGAAHFLTKPPSISALTKILCDFFKKENLSYVLNLNC